jgi:hypothetical protein
MRRHPRNSPEQIAAARALADDVLRTSASHEPRPVLRVLGKAAPSPDDLQDHLNRAHNAIVHAGAFCKNAPKAAEGKRNSHEDQAWLNSAHKHIVAAGGVCPGEADNEDDAKDNDQPTDAASWHDYFQQALRKPVPDSFAPALQRRREALGIVTVTADLDRRYSPTGQPPDGYALGLASRRLQREARAARASAPVTESRVDLHRDANGTPDPYAAGLAARRAR